MRTRSKQSLVFMASAAHIWFVFKRRKKNVPLLTLLHLCSTVVPLSPILTVRQYLPLGVSFRFLPTSFFVSLLMLIYMFSNSRCLPVLSSSPHLFFSPFYRPPLHPSLFFPNSLLSNTLFSSHQPLSALLSPT